MQGCGCVLAALKKEREGEIMAWCGRITVTFCPALQEGIGRRVQLVYTSFDGVVVAPGLSVRDLLWAYHFMLLAM